MPPSRLWKAVFFALAGVVLWLALTPQPPHTLDTGWDKLNHALAFCALALSGRFGFPGTPARAGAVAAGLLAFGIVIEFMQSFVPSRSSEFNDVLADGVGIALGLLAAAMARRLMAR